MHEEVLWEPAIREADVARCHPNDNAHDHLPQTSMDSMVKQVTEHRKGRTNLANLREAGTLKQ